MLDEMPSLSYDVRIFSLEKRRNKAHKITSYRVGWTVAGSRHRKTFANRAQADSFRAELIIAARHGQAFHVGTGEPMVWKQPHEMITWFCLAESYTATKWQQVSPNHRRGIAEALIDATESLITNQRRPRRKLLRAAMRWAFSTHISDPTDQPAKIITTTVNWLRRNTVSMDIFGHRSTGTPVIDNTLLRLSRTKAGKPAAANTTNRKRMVLHNTFAYACQTGVLAENPLTYTTWRPPRSISALNPRTVINSEQARRFLNAVEHHSERGARLKAFFGCMYYAALRPQEAAELRTENLTDLPQTPGRWGELQLTHSVPRSGSRWTNNGRPRERAPLKHRPSGDTRTVPMHPELAALLRDHLSQYGPASDRHLFIGAHGDAVTDRIYLKIFREAREAALTPAEAETPLLAVPYSLRHAAVSTWLQATGDPAQVAAWAGHGVDVLLRVYAKCVDGPQTANLQKILDATP